MKKVSIFLFIIFMTQVGCQRESAGTGGEPESGFEFYDPSLQLLFIEKLNEKGVDFKLHKDGSVLYFSRDELNVSEIRSNLLENSFMPSIHYEDVNLEESFKARLKLEKIQFGIKLKQGKRWITWSEKDNERVERIEESIW